MSCIMLAGKKTSASCITQQPKTAICFILLNLYSLLCCHDAASADFGFTESELKTKVLPGAKIGFYSNPKIISGIINKDGTVRLSNGSVFNINNRTIQDAFKLLADSQSLNQYYNCYDSHQIIDLDYVNIVHNIKQRQHKNLIFFCHIDSSSSKNDLSTDIYDPKQKLIKDIEPFVNILKNKSRNQMTKLLGFPLTNKDNYYFYLFNVAGNKEVLVNIRFTKNKASNISWKKVPKGKFSVDRNSPTKKVTLKQLQKILKPVKSHNDSDW